MSTGAALAQQVRERAGSRCEYCMMHQSLQGATFHIEHIIPEAQGGASALENLALACPGCNLRKSDRVQCLDADTNVLVHLFHPRRQRWSDHFVFQGYQVVGKTAVGRTTIDALELNHSRRILIREAEEKFGLFSPEAR